MTPEEELARIEIVLIEALNALHTVRRQHKLGVNPKTACENAKRMGADWPETGSRQVNWTILKRLRPPKS